VRFDRIGKFLQRRQHLFQCHLGEIGFDSRVFPPFQNLKFQKAKRQIDVTSDERIETNCKLRTMKISPPVDLASLAHLILSSDCQSIGMLTGAGVSLAAGIPDFRTPLSGIYDSLRPELLTATEKQRDLIREDPTYVFSWDLFRHNSLPFLEVCRPAMLGTREQTWKATIAHRFADLLHSKTKKLTRIYTQNVDGLDYQSGTIPSEKIAAVHGSFSRVSCDNCGHHIDFDYFCDLVKSNIKDIYYQDSEAPTESTEILCEHCHKPLVKPKTVLFGQQLPVEFVEYAADDLPSMDLLIIAGTSLVVPPVNSLASSVPTHTIRVVVNRHPVGAELGIDYSPNAQRDLFLQGDCEEIFLKLIEALGWMDDLKQIIGELPSKSADLVRRASNDICDVI